MPCFELFYSPVQLAHCNNGIVTPTAFSSKSRGRQSVPAHDRQYKKRHLTEWSHLKHDRRQKHDHEACRVFRQRVANQVIISAFLSPFPGKGSYPGQRNCGALRPILRKWCYRVNNLSHDIFKELSIWQKKWNLTTLMQDIWTCYAKTTRNMSMEWFLLAILWFKAGFPAMWLAYFSMRSWCFLQDCYQDNCWLNHTSILNAYVILEVKHWMMSNVFYQMGTQI